MTRLPQSRALVLWVGSLRYPPIERSLTSPLSTRPSEPVSLSCSDPFAFLDSQYAGRSLANGLAEMEGRIRPENWHNIPKCVVEAVRYLLDAQKFDSGKIAQQ